MSDKGGVAWYKDQVRVQNQEVDNQGEDDQRENDQREKEIESMEKTILPADDFVVNRDMIPVPKGYHIDTSDLTRKSAAKKFWPKEFWPMADFTEGTIVVLVHFLDPKTKSIDKRKLVQVMDMDGNIATFKQSVQSQLPGSELISKYGVFNMPTISNQIFGEDEKTFCCQRIADSVPTNDILNGIDFVPHLLFCPPQNKDFTPQNRKKRKRLNV
jgi:hypothetical protein